MRTDAASDHAVTTSPQLPVDLTTRPLTREDSRPVFELIAAQEREDTGRVNIEEAAEWRLYEKVGMVVTSNHVNRAIHL